MELTKREIETCLKKYDHWTVNKKQTEFSRTFDFDEHIDALVFIARVTVHAEILEHHPDITFSHKKVKVALTTHSFKALTKVDMALLERIETIASKVHK